MTTPTPTADASAVEEETDWRSLDTITVPRAARVLGISRGGAYEAARTGELPTLRIHHRLVVPVARLRRMLGEVD
jgi:Helix-turn-helix domain